MQQHVHLILLDRLGYSEWMKNPDEPLSARIDVLKKLMLSIDRIKKERRTDIELYSHFYADNLLLWTPDYSLTGAEYIFFYGSFLLSFLFHIGWPMRGAVASGEMYMSFDELIFQGTPLIEAHEGGSSQKWLGTIITQSTLSEVGSTAESSIYLTKYDVPIKSHKKKRCLDRIWTAKGNSIKKQRLVLDWPRIGNYTPKWCRSYLCNLDDLQYLKDRAPKKVKLRYDATIEFYNKRIEG